MDMPRCETCKHWEAPTPPVLWGECKRIYDIWCVDGLNNPFITDPESAFWSPALIEHSDPDNKDCEWLQTLPVFGCVLHEPKE